MSKHLVFPQPIAHSPTKLESRSAPQRFRRRLDRWPSGGPWRLATPPAAPAATALDRGRSPPTRAVHGAGAMPQTARTAHSGRRAIARRREKKTYTVIIPVVRQNTQPTLHSHHPHVKLEISFKASHARNATPIRKLATGPRLVLASLAPPTWLVPRAREGARVARRDQPYTARLRPRRPR
jgi:hypothetical protein